MTNSSEIERASVAGQLREIVRRERRVPEGFRPPLTALRTIARAADMLAPLASVGEHAQREDSQSEAEARRAADAVPSEETADAPTPTVHP